MIRNKITSQIANKTLSLMHVVWGWMPPQFSTVLSPN